MEDEQHCLLSAIEIRRFLTQLLTERGATIGRDLTSSVKSMRAMTRRFVEQAGPDARNFIGGHQYGEPDLFSQALGALQQGIGYHLAALAWQYKIEVEADLESIFPVGPDDDTDPANFIPGFDQPT
jgi:hypothetical protein